MVYNIDDGFLPTVLKATDKTKKFQVNNIMNCKKM